MIEFKCLRCGDCCHAKYVENRIGYIPIFLDEIDRIIELAKKSNKKVIIKPDFVYADKLNKQLIIATYEMVVDQQCIFYQDGCSIYDERPIICRAFPIMTFRIDSFRKLLHINNGCRFVMQNPELYNYKFSELIKIFPTEYQYAKELMNKTKDIIFKILQLETDGIIDIGFLENNMHLFGLDVKDMHDEKFKNWKLVRLSQLKI
ncbi:MAG: YkgJ family cysteine cluster protein [Candidatus Helarchaeota archaeon]